MTADDKINEAVKHQPGEDFDTQFVRAAGLFRALYRGAGFDAFWLQFGNWDPYCKARAKQLFK